MNDKKADPRIAMVMIELGLADAPAPDQPPVSTPSVATFAGNVLGNVRRVDTASWSPEPYKPLGEWIKKNDFGEAINRLKQNLAQGRGGVKISLLQRPSTTMTFTNMNVNNESSKIYYVDDRGSMLDWQDPRVTDTLYFTSTLDMYDKLVNNLGLINPSTFASVAAERNYRMAADGNMRSSQGLRRIGRSTHGMLTALAVALANDVPYLNVITTTRSHEDIMVSTLLKWKQALGMYTQRPAVRSVSKTINRRFFQRVPDDVPRFLDEISRYDSVRNTVYCFDHAFFE